MHCYLEEVFGEVAEHGIECIVTLRKCLEKWQNMELSA